MGACNVKSGHLTWITATQLLSSLHERNTMDKLIIIGLLVTMCTLCTAAFAEDPEPVGGCMPMIRYFINETMLGVEVKAYAYNMCVGNTGPLITKMYFYNEEYEPLGTQTEEGDIDWFTFTCEDLYYYYVEFRVECSECGGDQFCSDGGLWNP